MAVYLVFQTGSEQHALDSRHIVEIVPRIPLQPIPASPEYVAGEFQYRGTTVPVIDLTRFLIDRTSSCSMSTRIVLVRYTPGTTEDKQIVGLMAERILDTTDHLPHENEPKGTALNQTESVDELKTHHGEPVRQLDVDALLSDELQRTLWKKS